MAGTPSFGIFPHGFRHTKPLIPPKTIRREIRSGCGSGDRKSGTAATAPHGGLPHAEKQPSEGGIRPHGFHLSDR